MVTCKVNLGESIRATHMAKTMIAKQRHPLCLRAARLGIVLTLAVGISSPVRADPESDAGSEAICRLHDDLSVERQLRRLSLDLRGDVPSYEEYELVEGRDSVPAEVVDQFLASDAFRLQARRYHERLLWSNPAGASLTDNNYTIRSNNMGPNDPVWLVTDRGIRGGYRGGDGSHRCQNVPQEQLGYTAEGAPVAQYMGEDDNGAWSAEGWVEITPYWAPETKIKVCAFDAQTNSHHTVVQNGQTKQYDCSTRYGVNRKSCGCGPNLRHCIRNGFDAEVKAALREQMLQLVDEHSDGSHPYSELITTRRAHFNGKLLHFYRYLSQRASTGRTFNDHMPQDATLPAAEAIEWNDPVWHPLERQAPHAGVLSLPAFTLRFQTNRGRANRTRIVFAGQYFQPPDVGDYNGCSPDTDDLSQRCICRKCHSTLEPMAAHFGQIAEAGSAIVTSFGLAHKTATNCNNVTEQSNSSFCRRFYKKVKSSMDKDYVLWRLRSLEYADDQHPSVQENFDAGPAGLANELIASGQFARATVKNVFEYLFQREMILDPSIPHSELALLEELASEFQAHDDFRKLVKRLVMLPQYRRTP